MAFSPEVASFLRYSHIMFGIFWMGLLWFFNIINGGFMAKISPETKKDIFPKLMEPCLWWFRWTAMGTVLFGLLLLENMRQIYGSMGNINVGILLGAFIALTMWFNVWFVIWPRQKLAIGGFRGENEPPAPEVMKVAAMASRYNAWMSVPMIFLMVYSSHNAGFFPTWNALFG